MSLLGTVIRTGLVKLLDYEKEFICNQCKTVFSVEVRRQMFSYQLSGYLRLSVIVQCGKSRKASDLFDIKVIFYHCLCFFDFITFLSCAASGLNND